MPRILWLNPPCYRSADNIWYTLNVVMPPLGIGYCAAVLEEAGFTDQTVLDLQAEPRSMGQVQAAMAEGRYDWVAITSTTLQINGALHLARLARKVLPECRVVLGGPHPTACPEECLAEPAVDVVARGEGEFTMLDLVSGKPLFEVPGISFRSAGGMVHNPGRPLLADLDCLPPPAYHLLPMSRYRAAPGSYKRLPAMSLMTSRGCQWSCVFCNKEMFGNRVRVRSHRKVFAEMDLLLRRYGVREFLIYDDTFTCERGEVLQLCDLLISRNLGISWSCMSRVDLVDEELLARMKQAGCHQICYGVESGNQRIIDNLNKAIRIEQVRAVTAMTKKAGIDVRLSFMLGSPGETAETLEDTIQFAIELDPYIAQFNVTVPYPGTRLHRWAESHGYLLSKDWDEYDLGRPLLQLPTLDNEVLMSYYRAAYRRFFLRPRFLVRQLFRHHTWTEFRAAISVLPGMLRMAARPDHTASRQ